MSLMVPCLRQFLPLEYTEALLQSAGVPVAFGSVQHRPLPEEMPSCVPTAPAGPPLAPNDSERPLRDGLDWGLHRWPRPSRAQLRLSHSLSAILRQEGLENTLAHAGDLRAAYFVLTVPWGA